MGKVRPILSPTTSLPSVSASPDTPPMHYDVPESPKQRESPEDVGGGGGSSAIYEEIEDDVSRIVNQCELSNKHLKMRTNQF